jgi:hypothetical protein
MRVRCRGARVSSISSRGDELNQNLLYPPLEEEGSPLFAQFSQMLLNQRCEFWLEIICPKKLDLQLKGKRF